MTEWKRELHDVLEVDKSGEGDEGVQEIAILNWNKLVL